MSPGYYVITPKFLDGTRKEALTREVRLVSEEEPGVLLIEEVVKDGKAGKLWSRGDHKRISTSQWEVTPVEEWLDTRGRVS